MAVFDGTVFDPIVFEAQADVVVTGAFELTGDAALTGFPQGIATGTLELNGSAIGTTQILGIAVGTMELNGSAIGFRARFVRRLLKCGEPLTTFCQDWILGNNDPRRNG